MSKKNALYCCCLREPWLDVIKDLETDGIEPKYFIGWKDDNIGIVKSSLKNCFYHSVEDLWHGIGFPNNKVAPIDMKLLEEFAKEQILALKMMDRLDPDRHSFVLSDRQNYFYRLLGHWLYVIEKYEIDIIIYSVIPHRVFDFVLYIAAKMKNIPTIMFQMSIFDGYIFLIDNIWTIPKNMIDDVNNTDNIQNYSKNIYEEILPYIEKVKYDKYDEAKPSYMKNIEVKDKSSNYHHRILTFIKDRLLKILDEVNSYHVQYENIPEKSKITYIHYKWLQYKTKKYLRFMENHYKNIIDEIKKNEKYVFVALHYQPEETTNPSGGLWENQFLMLLILDSILPKDITIIVKEHKVQFNINEEGATARTVNYYKQILDISNRIKFVSVDANPFELIDNALITITITGTIAWESAIRGTPAIVFGRVWYEGMPGIMRVSNNEEFEKAIKLFLDSNYKIDYNKILIYHKKLTKYLIKAKFYKQDNIESISIEESAKQLSNIIRNYYNELSKNSYTSL